MNCLISVLIICVLLFNITLNCISEVSAVREQAITDAKVDATNDFSKRTWCAFGAFLPLSPVLGCLVGTAINNASSGGVIIGPNDTQSGVAIAFGLTACVALPLSISKMPIQPSPERLLGKSPEYVRSYTKAYEEKTLKSRENRLPASQLGQEQPA